MQKFIVSQKDQSVKFKKCLRLGARLMDLDNTDCELIAEHFYKFINIIYRNKLPCPNCAEKNKQMYLAESDIYSFWVVLCIQKVGDVSYIPEKQLWGNCSSVFVPLNASCREPLFFYYFSFSETISIENSRFCSLCKGNMVKSRAKQTA